MPRQTASVIIAITPQEIARVTTPVVRETAVTFGKRTVSELMTPEQAHEFDLSRVGVARFLRRYGADMVQANRTTQKQIARVLSEQAALGATPTQMASAITAKFRQIASGRAVSLARTAVARASNYGLVEGFAKAGVKGKRWVSTDDDRVRDTHEELGGSVVRLAAYFEVDDEQALYPGDFGVPELDMNCRCGLEPVWRMEKRGSMFTWRALEDARLPFDRAYLRAIRVALARQAQAALAALQKVA